jgi:hypothetical protein
MEATSIGQFEADNEAVYRHALSVLTRAGAEYLVGGTYGLEPLTGLSRRTRDLDIFVRPAHLPQVLEVLEGAGFAPELTYPHWLAKVFRGETFIDIIFSSGNGIAEIDDEWFSNAIDAELLGMPVRLCPPEETIWSKAFIMERERFDGADIVHIIRHSGSDMDWRRLMRRFGDHWRVLFSHLTLFGYVYPAERAIVPDWVMFDLMRRMLGEIESDPEETLVCRGTLLSRTQYRLDVSEWGYEDARTAEGGKLSECDAAHWSRLAEE